MSHVTAVVDRMPGPSKALKVLMWVLFVALLLGLYGNWLLYDLGWLRPLWRTPIVGGVVGLPLYIFTIIPASVFYAGQTPFLVLWCVGLALSVLLWIISQRGWIARAVSFVPLVLLVIAPYAIQEIYGTYSSLETFESPPGYEVNWLTRPESSLAGAIRRGLSEMDDIRGSCEYRLLGWSGDNKFYYSRGYGYPNCIYGDGKILWLYDPVSGNAPERIKRLPDGFTSSATVLRGPRHPDEAEMKAENPNFVEISAWKNRLVEESTSPDGTMRAAVIQDFSAYLYEVIVMRRADP
ncbi:MAG: hypothetical protein OXC27_21490 [Caldilineaceae bacterium]|nr:hypothetical protein [Caldilineaceae bacterium]